MLRLARLGLASELSTKVPNTANFLRRNAQYKSARRFSTEKGQETQETFEDFGDYSIIFPPDPIVWGVSHIQPRTVPPHIRRPPYAILGSESAEAPTHESSGIIILGGEAEHKIREAASLAKKVREFAGTQVKVRIIDIWCKELFLNPFFRLVPPQMPSIPPFTISL